MSEDNIYNIPENEAKIYNAPSPIYIPTKNVHNNYYVPILDPKLELKYELRKTVNKASSGLLIFYYI